MPRILISLAALAALTLGAHAQAPASPPAAANAPSAEAKPSQAVASPSKTAPASPANAPQAAASAPGSPPSDKAAQAKPVGSGTATEWTYKTKDGQMYQPPEQRPDSPAMETKTYGRT